MWAVRLRCVRHSAGDQPSAAGRRIRASGDSVATTARARSVAMLNWRPSIANCGALGTPRGVTGSDCIPSDGYATSADRDTRI